LLCRRTTLTRGNGTVTTYGFDTGDRLTSLALAMPPAASDKNIALSFGYTNANQLSSRTLSNGLYDWTNHTGGTTNLTPDGLNRDAAIVTASGYDANANQTKDAAAARTFAFDKENRLTTTTVSATSTTVALTYDPTGRLYQ